MLSHILEQLSEQEIRSRYALQCTVCEPDTQDKKLNIETHIRTLEAIIELKLPALTLKCCPDNFTELHRALRTEMVRFREFCEYQELSGKLVVGFGGSFSSGKSSLINALVKDRKCLVTEVDPTTSLPAYLIRGTAEKIEVRAINIFNRVVSLTHKQFRTLTHEEKSRYGSKVSALLKSVIVSHPNLPWQNLALLDTPGYSKSDEAWSERTDASLAQAQLNSAQFIVWVVPADNGTITEEDITFLASLERHIPKLVVVSRADKHLKKDITLIVELIRKTLQQRGIIVLDVLPFTNRGKEIYPPDPLLAWFEKWNNATRNLGFAEQFKRQFMAYKRFIDARNQQEKQMLSKFNRLNALSDDADEKDDLMSLRLRCKNELTNLEEIKLSLAGLQNNFFRQLKKIGDAVGIPLPEPDAISLLEPPGIKLSDMLDELASQQHIEIARISPVIWKTLSRDMQLRNLDRLLHNKPTDYILNKDEDDRLIIDLVRPDLESLAQHYLSDKELAVKERYLVLLLALLLEDNPVSDVQIHLLKKLIASIQDVESLEYYMQQVAELDKKELITSLELIRDDPGMSNSLIFDLLVVLRSAGVPSQKHVRQFEHMSRLLGVSDDNIYQLIYFILLLLNGKVDMEHHFCTEDVYAKTLHFSQIKNEAQKKTYYFRF